MTLEQAIEIVERRCRAMEDWAAKVPTSEMGIDAEALRLVLARAKEPRVYALGKNERHHLQYLLTDANLTLEAFQKRPPQTQDAFDEMQEAKRTNAALTAALNLQQPQAADKKEPNV